MSLWRSSCFRKLETRSPDIKTTVGQNCSSRKTIKVIKEPGINKVITRNTSQNRALGKVLAKQLKVGHRFPK